MVNRKIRNVHKTLLPYSSAQIHPLNGHAFMNHPVYIAGWNSCYKYDCGDSEARNKTEIMNNEIALTVFVESIYIWMIDPVW